MTRDRQRSGHCHRGAAFACVAAAIVTAGCTVTIPLSPKVDAPPTRVTDGAAVAVAPKAQDVPTVIGRGTITVFAIPADSIQLDPEHGAAQIMDGVREALRSAGYTPVACADPPAGPFLTARITKAHFRNYTWLMPVILTWGTLRMSVVLAAPDGGTLWQRDYEGTYKGAEGFSTAVNEAFGQILTHSANDFASPQFRSVCCPTSPAATAAGKMTGSSGPSPGAGVQASVRIVVTGEPLAIAARLADEVRTRLQGKGYRIVEENTAPSLAASITEFAPGSQALRITVGFGAGATSLRWHARYARDDQVLAERDGTESFSGMEVSLLKKYGTTAGFGGEDTATRIVVSEAAEHIAALVPDR